MHAVQEMRGVLSGRYRTIRLDFRTRPSTSLAHAVPLTYRIDAGSSFSFRKANAESVKRSVPRGRSSSKRWGEFQVDVGTIVVATGYDPFDPRLKPEFGSGVTGTC